MDGVHVQLLTQETDARVTGVRGVKLRRSCGCRHRAVCEVQLHAPFGHLIRADETWDGCGHLCDFELFKFTMDPDRIAPAMQRSHGQSWSELKQLRRGLGVIRDLSPVQFFLQLLVPLGASNCPAASGVDHDHAAHQVHLEYGLSLYFWALRHVDACGLGLIILRLIDVIGQVVEHTRLQAALCATGENGCLVSAPSQRLEGMLALDLIRHLGRIILCPWSRLEVATFNLFLVHAAPQSMLLGICGLAFARARRRHHVGFTVWALHPWSFFNLDHLRRLPDCCGPSSLPCVAHIVPHLPDAISRAAGEILAALSLSLASLLEFGMQVFAHHLF